MNKIFFNVEFEDKPFAKFQKQGDLPDEINLPFLAYSDKWNSNTQRSDWNIKFDIKDLVEPEKTKLLYNHTDETNEPKDDQIIQDSYIYDKKIEVKKDKDGEYEILTGILHSTNKKFIQEIKDSIFKGFSGEVFPLNRESVWFNSAKQVEYKQSILKYMAALTEQEGAVPSAGVIGKLNFSKNADFGYEDIPSKVFFNNLNNNNMDEKQFNQLLEAVNKQVETSVEAKFTALQEAQKEAQTVKFSLEKDTTPEKAFEVLQAKFSTLSDYELVKKEAGEDEPDPKDEVKLAKYQEKLAKVSKDGVKKVTKFSGEEKEEKNILNGYFV